jgi:hypothetical protein
MVNGLICYYAAYLLLALFSLAILEYHHEAAPWMTLITFAFAIVAVVIPDGAAWS